MALNVSVLGRLNFSSTSKMAATIGSDSAKIFMIYPLKPDLLIGAHESGGFVGGHPGVPERDTGAFRFQAMWRETTRVAFVFPKTFEQ